MLGAKKIPASLSESPVAIARSSPAIGSSVASLRPLLGASAPILAMNFGGVSMDVALPWN
jgi:hypothetical protein